MSNIFYTKFKYLISKMKTNQSFHEYVRLMRDDHPFYGFPRKNIGDCSADPKEFFTHYDAYSFWLAEKLGIMGNNQKIVDLGNRKVTNALLSLTNDVTAIVLDHCDDRISKVQYVKHDISDPLPFPDNSFDIFTSLGTLQLVGLGRYGDKLNPYVLIDFIAELDRIMKRESHLIFSSSLGPNYLYFNNGWGLEFETTLQLFSKWKLVDYIIDNGSIENPPPFTERYTKDLNSEGYSPYRVAFFHFHRNHDEQ
jgi:Caenorhabditis protein of unknown function, DUF268.